MRPVGSLPPRKAPTGPVSPRCSLLHQVESSAARFRAACLTPLPDFAAPVIFGLMSDVTRILSAIEQGDPHAAEQLLPLVYDELRQLAAQKLAQEKPDQTLQATALVHEAYLRLVDVERVQNWD